MEHKPEFTVIAGPNGAGKSRLGPFFVKVKSFDGDKLALNLRREHPDWPEHWIGGSVATALEKQTNSALERREDFAFETNFSTEMVINMIQRFKDAGYEITLCYLGLYSEEESVSRVMLRSKTGGHDVSDEVIRFNFNEGSKKAKECLHLFDNITFVDGTSDFGKVVALYSKKNSKHEVMDNPPRWFKEQFEKAFGELLFV